ncbi:MAG: hypothetical protein HZC12_03320 [Nitrospirae bacterium]|nr:hypothetical protein [Nitrospirota bacterium]
MKAIIEISNGLYLIRINRTEGSLCDVYVVEDIEFKMQDQNEGCIKVISKS